MPTHAIIAPGGPRSCGFAGGRYFSVSTAIGLLTKEEGMASFVDNLGKSDKSLINALRRIIKSTDKAVTEKPGAIMAAKDALCYNEDGVFKYGLAATKTGYSFHSMVMYANPDVADFVKKNMTGIKLQKGCINIADLAGFDLDVFEQMMHLSAARDFSPVIAHYKSKRK